MRILKNSLLLLLVAVLLNCAIPQNEKLILSYKGNPHLRQNGKYLLFNEKPFDGALTEMYENGELKSQAYYKNGLLDGSLRSWYQNGSKESERYHKRGEKEGVHSSWWPNGNLRFEYQFAGGLYHGTFKEWYESGKPLHVFEYDHGNEVRAIGWRENGKTYINFAVKNGRKYGLTNARLCYSLKDERGIYQSSNN